MTYSMLTTPFDSAPLAEIKLDRPPLVRVIAQLRFPSLGSMSDGAVARSFAKELAGDYPLAEEVAQVSFALQSPGDAPQSMVVPAWRLRSADESWLVTLSRDSLSLEALSYESRRGFIKRMRLVSDAFRRLAQPPRYDRLGVRYFNRVDDTSFLRTLHTMVRPELTGMTTIDRSAQVELHHSMSEAQYNDGPHSLLIRTGVLPAGATIDVNIPAVDRASWILDIDSSIAGVGVVPVNDLGSSLSDLAARAYRFFRYAVNEEFLDQFEPIQ